MTKRSQRPRIGVTGPNRGGWPAWIFARWALYRAGATAVRVRPGRSFDPAELRGFVIGGGADVSEPLDDAEEAASAAPPKSRVLWPRRIFDLLFAPLVLLVRLLFSTKGHGVDPSRDAMELRLLAYARDHGLPVLGICRGAQLMNLAEGGTLQRNINTLYTERPVLYTALPRREVQVLAGSRLERIVERSDLLVNSLHFHAVREPGSGMRIVAREPSGVPQAIEHTQRPFWLGVQWHPEYLPQQEIHQRIFCALAQAAREASASQDSVRIADATLETRAS